MGANLKAETLNDLVRGGGNIAVSCRCGRRGVVAGAIVPRYFLCQRWDGQLDRAKRHFRCSRCGGRPERFGLTHDRPSFPTWGPQTERDWTLLVRRLRD